jgi:hypothetical protein
MTEKQVYARLYHHLGELFAPLGFELQRDDERHNTRFVRSGGDITQSISIPLYNYCPLFRFSLFVGFRSDAAEDLYNLFSGVLPEYQATSKTCIVLVESLTSEIPERIEVSTAAEIQEKVSGLAPILERDVFPFLNAHQDIASLDRLINGEERELCHRIMEPDPSMHAVVIAYLHGRSDLSRIMTSRRKTLLKLDEEELARYDGLVAHLKAHPR